MKPDETCGNESVIAGPINMPLKEYYNYSDNTHEESPLYVFDKRFADKIPALAQDYTVPEYFNEDLFKIIGSERPDYRWIIIGPARSGSNFHIDPNATQYVADARMTPESH